MKVYFRSGLSEQDIELPPDTRHYFPPMGGQLRICWEGDPPKEIKINGELQLLNEADKQLLLPPDNGGNGTVIKAVRHDNSRSTYEILNYPESSPSGEFLQVLADFQGKLGDYSDEGSVTFSSVENAIDHGLLLGSRDKHTRESTEWLLDDIEKTLPYLIRVCNRPRQHLRTEEQVLPVEIVRRIGPPALRYLASHSEHWQARTVSGLRPARLYAETVEDDLEIYENRFVKTLIDRLLTYISHRIREVEDIKTEANNVIDWDQYAREFHDYKRQEILNRLLPKKLEQKLDDQKFYNSLYQRLRRTEQQLVSCTATRFYQTLKRSEPVFSPIQPTNILTMDSNYRCLLGLWRQLEQAKQKVENAIDGYLPENLETAYAAYCQFALLAALVFKGFKPAQDNATIGFFTSEKLFKLDCVLSLENWRIGIKGVNSLPFRIEVVFKRRYDTELPIPSHIHVPIIPEDLRDKIQIEKKKLKFLGKPGKEELNRLSKLLHVEENKFSERDWQERQKAKRGDRDWSDFIHSIQNDIRAEGSSRIQLIPLLFEFGQDSQHIDKSTQIILQESVDNAGNMELTALVTLTPASPVVVSQNTTPNVVRRIVNIGDVFVEEDARLWGSKRAGIIPVSPWQINSVQRLIRLINSYTIGHDITVGEPLNLCPVCASAHIVSAQNGEFRCRDCNALWSKTTCPYSDCRNEFGFLRPNVKSRSRNHSDIKNYGSLIEHLENAAGGVAIHGFCESSEVGVTEFPICPKCGRCSRQGDHKDRCLRCKTSR